MLYNIIYVVRLVIEIFLGEEVNYVTVPIVDTVDISLMIKSHVHHNVRDTRKHITAGTARITSNAAG